MPEKRHWLDIRLSWQQHICPVRGDFRTAKVGYIRERLPWLESKTHVTAAIYQLDQSIELYDTESASAIQNMTPFWRIDRESSTLTTLGEVTRWPVTEAIYSAYTGCDLAEEYRSIFELDAVIRRWQCFGIKGWWVIKRRWEGMTLARDFLDVRDGGTHAVAISYQGITMYRHDLLRGSDLADRDRIMHLRTMRLDMDRLTKRFCRDDAINIRLACRHYRLMMYDMALEYGQPY